MLEKKILLNYSEISLEIFSTCTKNDDDDESKPHATICTEHRAIYILHTYIMLIVRYFTLIGFAYHRIRDEAAENIEYI